MADPNTERELNRLYWDTDASVSEIADRLDISRRALYDGIEPRPAGRPCPQCGAALGFRNRTALETGEAKCPECGFEMELEPPEAAGEADDEATGAGGNISGLVDRRRLPDAGSGPVLGGTFLAGLAVGALVTFLARRH